MTIRPPISVFRPTLALALLLMSGGPTALRAADAAPSPVWPLDLTERYLTSNFMEYRPGRFHAGLDLKTRSQEGFAARAVEDGWILRVRATPGAYGRAVYLRGESGRTYVYAHLSRFNDPIRALVREKQAASGRYRTRLSFGAGKMPVRAGEVLGLTGQSGTGGPHLHFEVRDARNRPVNPLAHGFEVDDRLPPVIHAVRAVPVRPSARVDGDAVAKVLEGPLTGEQPALYLYGPVAFAVKIVDASDRAGHRLEPWLIEARLDGKLVYRCRNDHFDFGESSLQRLEWLEVPGIRDRWLHRRRTNTLTGREGGPWHMGKMGDGLPTGDHLLEVTASDFAGNATTVTIPLKVGRPPRGADGWIEDPVRVAVDSLANGLGVSRLTPFFDVLLKGEGGWELTRLDPAAGDPVHAPTSLGVRAVPLGPDHLDWAREQGLVLLGQAVEFAAADWPISAAVPVDLPGSVWADVDSLGENAGAALLVYRLTRRGWRPAGSLLAPAGRSRAARFRLAAPGVHAVFLDETGPVITAPDTLAVVRGDSTTAHGVTLPRWAIFPVGVDDAGSGVATESIAVRLDGVPLVVEPDLIRDRILVELPDSTVPGRHALEVRCVDEAGHEAARTILLDCRREIPDP